MERGRRGRRVLAGISAIAGGVALAVASVPASAEPAYVNGQFALQTTSGPECESPIGVCMTGTVGGRIKGTFSFTATSVLTTDDTPVTGAIVTTGDATVATATGTITCKLTGTLQLSDDGPFVSLCIVTGGDGEWAGATGFLRTSGTFTFAAGGTGSYDGRVTTP